MRCVPALMAIGSLLFSSTAWSANPLPSGGLYEILPAPSAVGDGATEHTFHLLALDPNGAPVNDLKWKPTVSEGEASGWTMVSPGLYSFTVIPPALETESSITVTVRGKTLDKTSIERSLSVDVEPEASDVVAFTSNPASITLGRISEATVSFKLEGASGQDAGVDDLMVSANTGEITNLTPMGDGKFTARFVAPKVNYPHLAIITVADRRNPGQSFGHGVIPLEGSVDFPVQVGPNANVILNVGDGEFGPVAASPQGRANVPIIVPPGAVTATLTSVSGGDSKEEIIDLRVPETLRVRLLPTPPTIPSDSRVQVPLRVLVLTPKGGADSAAKLNLSVTAGEVGDPAHIGDGIYEAMYTPPDGKALMAATVQASIAGSSIQVDSQEISLVPAMPVRLLLTADPVELGPDSTALKIFARVEGGNGAGMGDRKIVFAGSGATLKGVVEDMKAGDYRADFTANGKSNVEIFGVVTTPGSANRVAGVVVLPAQHFVPNDGSTSALLTVATVDEFGYPVPNVKVILALDQGDGTLPSDTTTNTEGVSQIFYTAGTAAQVVQIRGTAAGRSGVAGLLQASGLNMELPVSGSAAQRSRVSTWRGLQTSLTVPREGSGVMAGGPTLSEADAGSVSAIRLEAQPSVAAPGGTVMVVINAVDSAGVAVSGQSFDLLSTKGSFGVVSDMGNGQYQVAYTVPTDAKGTVKVSVMHPGASAFVELPIAEGAVVDSGTADGPAWGATDDPAWGALSEGDPTESNEATEGTEPVEGTETAVADGSEATTETAKKPKPAPTSTDRPWLRIRAAGLYSTYAFEQTPSESPGPLLPATLQVGGQQAGGSSRPADAWGFEVGANAWLEKIPYIGARTHFRFSTYALNSAALSENIRDNLYNFELDLAGRYPFKVGADQFYVGGRIGFKYDDFMVFKGCLDPGCVVEYEPVGVAAAALGLELGADIEKFFIVAAFTGGLANFSQPYSATVDAQAGYNVHENVFVEVGFTGVFRDLTLRGEESELVRGRITDSQVIAKLGVGVSF